MTELLAVISIIVTLTSFGFYAFSSARQFAGRQETDASAAIARVSANSRMQRMPPATPTTAIPLPQRRPYVPQGGPNGYQQIGTSPVAPHTPYVPSLTRAGAALDAYLTRAANHGSHAPLHFTAAPTYGLRDMHFVGAPAMPPVWKTTYDPAVDTFILHSKPGSNFVIYLDFDGHVVPATNQWAIDFNNGAAITAVAWSMDADRTTFSTAERNKIILMWARVAEDFAPFDVDVTTEPPAAADLVNSGGADTKWGIRVIIGLRPVQPSSPTPKNDWSTAGGIAYRPSFKNSVDICCWAWNGDLSATPENSLPTTISHEVGHTLGLNHDGDSTKTAPNDEYYLGHVTNNGGWGSIMGGAFSRNVDQWSRQTYPGANNNEDDLSIIVGGTSGLTYRIDDHAGGDNVGSPTALNTAGVGALTTTYGIIEKNTDVDIFVFYADQGTSSIKVEPLSYAPNLDVKAEIYSAAGVFLASGTRSTATSMDAEFTGGILSPGAYHLRVSGTGRGGVSDGYTSYGSLGNYRITGSVPPMTPIIVNTPGGSGGGTSGGIRVLNPSRWTFDPNSKTFYGYMTITNLGNTTLLTGSFKLNITLPDPTLTVVSSTGSQVGATFTDTFSGTLGPKQSLNMLLRLNNPTRRALPTGHHSFAIIVQQ